MAITSGNANAFTGEQGKKDARRIAQLVSQSFGLAQGDIIVNSTGIIGQTLEMGEIEELIGRVVGKMRDDSEGVENAASCMKTTDSFSKIASRTLKSDGEEIIITGIAKGAGMIAPSLSHATMIAIILTNGRIPKEKIDDLLKDAVDESFNMITVDGDTSTNDMVALLANGYIRIKDYSEFNGALKEVCIDLAKMIVRDGEGATKLFRVEISGARSIEDARKAAKAVAGSTLVKTALFGENPNWGRVIAAIGYSGAEFEKEKLSLVLRNDEVEAVLVKDGKGVAVKGSTELEKAGRILKSKEVDFAAHLGVGDAISEAYGCDLGYNYVKINAEYTS